MLLGSNSGCFLAVTQYKIWGCGEIPLGPSKGSEDAREEFWLEPSTGSQAAREQFWLETSTGSETAREQFWLKPSTRSEAASEIPLEPSTGSPARSEAAREQFWLGNNSGWNPIQDLRLAGTE